MAPVFRTKSPKILLYVCVMCHQKMPEAHAHLSQIWVPPPWRQLTGYHLLWQGVQNLQRVWINKIATLHSRNKKFFDSYPYTLPLTRLKLSSNKRNIICGHLVAPPAFCHQNLMTLTFLSKNLQWLYSIFETNPCWRKWQTSYFNLREYFECNF